ncbi:MAG: adenylyltransferase/cytidyltransferase family protein [Candidatus Levybacteria bacterium]|nr:adenylyltransferase/cytidyltransferase family protein [Candidatus Levybacteria bacterium]
MKKILTTEEAVKLAEKLRGQHKRIVLVGGCFDILHIGHIAFLENAKKQGDFLFVLLEHDESVRALKGSDRPINTQDNRAHVLSALRTVDTVIPLPKKLDDISYDRLTQQIKPAIIAITKHDPFKKQKQRQAEKTGAKVIEVIAPLADTSTSKLAQLLAERLY